MPCFIRQVQKEIDSSDLEEGKKVRVMREMLSLLSEMEYEKAPVDVSLIMHNRMMEIGVVDDPYHALKVTSTSKALETVKKIEKEITLSEYPVYESILASLAGNVIDYGAKNQLDLHEVLENARRKGFRLNDHGRFLLDLQEAKKIVIFLDNSGEVVFDHLMIRTIHGFFPDIRFKVIVKRVPLLNDVTRDDVVQAGMTEEYIEIEELPVNGWVKPEHLEHYNDADILLAKGQGNFESLSEARGVYFLLIVKCDVVAEYLNVDLGEMVFMYTGDR
jgi:uncharacterized protein with ATP-grasp and redox domains